MREDDLKEVAIKDIGIGLANNTGVAGRYLYHQGYSLDDIASTYRITNAELLIEILTVFKEVKGSKWIEGKMVKLI